MQKTAITLLFFTLLIPYSATIQIIRVWQAPADTFFQYIPMVAGLYEYECTPHISFGMTGVINANTVPTKITSVFQQKTLFILVRVKQKNNMLFTI